MKKKDGIDALLAKLEELLPETAVFVKNKERYDEAQQAIREISDFVWQTDKNAKINVFPDELIGSSLCVEIIASLVVIEMVDKFCDALRKADNFEIYPREDGNIALGLVFEDAWVPAPPRQ